MGLPVCPGLQPSRFPSFHTNPKEGEVLGEAAGIRAHFQQERGEGDCQGGSILSQVPLAGVCSKFGP